MPETAANRAGIAQNEAGKWGEIESTSWIGNSKNLIRMENYIEYTISVWCFLFRWDIYPLRLNVVAGYTNEHHEKKKIYISACNEKSIKKHILTVVYS